MISDSLAARLGLRVGLMSVALVTLLGVVGYLTLAQGLQRIAKSNIQSKMVSIEDNVSRNLSLDGISPRSHVLVDLAMGHNNLYVSIYKDGEHVQPLLTIGSRPIRFELHKFPSDSSIRFHEWQDPMGRPMMSASQSMILKDGESIDVYLTVDRSSDAELLELLPKGMLIASPLLLLVILVIAWWTVRKGLAPLTSFLNIASKISTDNLQHRLPTEKLPAELRQLADGINFMLHRLDDGVQQLSQFSDDLAHELRSPISNLMGKAQVVLSRDRSIEEYKDVLGVCIEELERVVRIVSDMLFLAQVSHPAAMVNFECVALEDELDRLLDLFSISAEEKNVRLISSGSGMVKGNRLMVQRAISNLLSNAIRHSPENTAVLIKIERTPECMRLTIGNPGAGIPSEHLPHLFERFYRVDKSRSRSEGGAGLGLAIVRSIMSLHHGKVAVQVKDGGYTRFFLEFPLPASGGKQ
ncbi:heavy metal sensor histidine kinase [Pseudomonas aeruginosa]|uniref:heavy metal sensor histidine kinase n=1 Tax=Pseudomonas aeruginosa TaxID=287 RepID=UPI0009365D82|nr:heavy metal sensor histidine kinase [Pseudomonas aeruginosa]EKJ8514522.1 heavy metal sensor histidine kinase [Pseudomonas aeruginosa]ELK7308617.1 heavy metal sensor histidine kinase [Pseudomonas aeruginosa]ELP0276336.1 heavy metal sensor histidine kinase [Pseudomonas aeruginosa]MBG4805739.1 heavy metal sensor histidine kinase [Pseudomonas aeruginosa]MBG5029264.1 heavy metal sensor histidine kinase [Pseudomonas aeruginosa]